MAKIWGKILGSIIICVKKLTFCNSDFSIGKAQKSESASCYILAKHENEFQCVL